ncbi:MAG: electron transport complex subunit RsxC [Oscillospiraceae bacterium]|nr:electron transport complex subunit RsxC [Oscillospiraceae bacterium]
MGKLRPDAILKAVSKGRGGIFVSHNKLTAENETVRMPDPERVVLPMLQHIGAPCTPTVKKGDSVAVGQVIGDSDKFLSVPIHASVSGTVESVSDVKLANGTTAPAVTIKSDGEMRLFEGLTPPVVNSKEDLIKAVRASGLVGLGGAGFPSFVKLTVSPEKPIDTLIVNAAECEPYITVDYRECIENSWNIMNGVYTLAELYGFKRVIIAVEDNKPQAIKILKGIADKDIDKGNVVRLMALKSRYPQGAEKMMVLSATGRKVPAGGLPSDVGCIVMNVGSVAFVARYLATGKPLISRTVTVSGDCIKNPMNLRVPIGTLMQDIVDFCGGFIKEPVKILSGGPMMGTAITDLGVPLLKSNNALLCFSKKNAGFKPESQCIHCGRCHNACPMGLMPTEIEKYAALKDAETLVSLGTAVCMECGSCAYSCPAGKPLVQHMRLAKSVMREAGKR